MSGKQVTELDALPSFTDNSLLPVHNGAGLKKGLLSQLANYLGTKFSNPNLLINPDFKINQRGKSTYSSTGAGTTVDRWIGTNVKTVVNSDNTVSVSSLSGTGYFTQFEENLSYGKHTYSIYVQAITGTVKAFYRSKGSTDVELGTLKQGLNTFTSTDDVFKGFFLSIASGSSVTLKYAKVEKGTVATTFIAPNRSEELVKCQYYTVIFEPWRTTLNANTDASTINIDTRCKMRTKPTVSYITLKSGTVNQFNFASIIGGKAYFALKSNNWSSFVDAKGEVVVVNTGTGINSGAFGQVTFDNSFILDAEIYS